MAVSFTVWDYWGTMLLLTLGAMALFLLTAIPLMRLIQRKTKSIHDCGKFLWVSN